MSRLAAALAATPAVLISPGAGASPSMSSSRSSSLPPMRRSGSPGFAIAGLAIIGNASAAR
jgi:hypothetical protein